MPEKTISEQIKISKEKDKIFIEKLTTNPVELYTQLRKIAEKNYDSQKNDFPFEPFLHILDRIILDLKNRCEDNATKHKESMAKIILEADLLLKEGLPYYKATHRFINQRYLPLIDQLCCENHPELMQNEFHKKTSSHLLEGYLDQAPELLLMYSFVNLKNDFFIRTRPAPFQILGLTLKGLDKTGKVPFADRFPMKNSEFTWHDLGHVDIMTRRDVMYLRASDKPYQRILAEWNLTKERIVELCDTIKTTGNINLYDALELLLMEYLHERGFQYSLTVLKNEMESPKWIEIIRRKKERGFFESFSHNKEMFHHLDEARELLLKTAIAHKIHDQKLWIKTLHATKVPVQIIHNPKTTYCSGHFKSLEFSNVTSPRLTIVDHNLQTYSTPSSEVILAQVDPCDVPFFDASKLAHIRHNLSQNLTIRIYKTQSEFKIEYFRQTANEKKDIKLHDGLIFEMEQILGAAARCEPLALILRPSHKVYCGLVNFYDEHSILIKTLDGDNIHLPLAEVRIDPLMKSPIL